MARLTKARRLYVAIPTQGPPVRDFEPKFRELSKTFYVMGLNFNPAPGACSCRAILARKVVPLENGTAPISVLLCPSDPVTLRCLSRSLVRQVSSAYRLFCGLRMFVIRTAIFLSKIPRLLASACGSGAALWLRSIFSGARSRTEDRLRAPRTKLLLAMRTYFIWPSTYFPYARPTQKGWTFFPYRSFFFAAWALNRF
jgi:hypothetical protein